MKPETELPADVIDALQKNRKIMAIKLLRAHLNIDLKEAKDMIDAYLARRPELAARHPQKVETGLGRLIVVGILLVALYAIYRYFS